jgi:hypothetical protein
MFRFVSLTIKILFRILNHNKAEPKQNETGQNEDQGDQQGKKRQIRAKQSETNRVKMKEWRNSRWNTVITVVSYQKVLVSVQPKLRNQLFRYFPKQPKLASLFRMVSKLVSVLSIGTEFRRTSYVSEFVSSQLFRIQSC